METIKQIANKFQHEYRFPSLDVFIKHRNYLKFRNFYESTLMDANFNNEEKELFTKVEDLSKQGWVILSTTSIKDVENYNGGADSFSKARLTHSISDSISFISNINPNDERLTNLPNDVQEAMDEERYQTVASLLEEVLLDSLTFDKIQNGNMADYSNHYKESHNHESKAELLFCLQYKSCMTFWEYFFIHVDDILEEDLPFSTGEEINLRVTRKNCIQLANAISLLYELGFFTF